jgi:hypothetical protein
MEEKNVSRKNEHTVVQHSPEWWLLVWIHRLFQPESEGYVKVQVQKALEKLDKKKC